MGNDSIDEVANWSLKRLVELMDSDDISVDDYNSFVQEYGDFIDIALVDQFGERHSISSRRESSRCQCMLPG